MRRTRKFLFCVAYLLYVALFVSGFVCSVLASLEVINSSNVAPLSSDRQHLSYGVCLEVIAEIIRTVLCCIVYDSCTQS